MSCIDYMHGFVRATRQGPAKTVQESHMSRGCKASPKVGVGPPAHARTREWVPVQCVAVDQGAGSVHVVCTLLMCCTLQLDTRCRLWRVRARDERQAGAALACVVRLPLPARRSIRCCSCSRARQKQMRTGTKEK